MMRQFAQAEADRQTPPLPCFSVYEHQWVEYGVGVQEWIGNDYVVRDVVLLILCARCRRTPDEVSKP
jgi:hypothetical protein